MQNRQKGKSRSQARRTNDNDFSKGLPVRRWRRELVAITAPTPTVDASQPELPQPEEAHLLSPTSQGLLAAARAGSSPDVVREAREPPHAEPLFCIKRWVRIPQEDEPPEPVYLAKLPKIAGKKVGDSTVANDTAVRGGVSVENTGSRSDSSPPMKNKRSGRKPSLKKSVSLVVGKAPTDPLKGEEQKRTADTADAMDIDAVIALEPKPQNAVANEMERDVATTEVANLEQNQDEVLHHSNTFKPNF